MNIFEKINLCDYMRFCIYHWKWGTNFIFQENNSKNLQNLQNIVNIFVFFMKISCQSKESPLSKQYPFSPTLPFLEKISHPTLIAKSEEVKPWRGGRTMDNLLFCAIPYLLITLCISLLLINITWNWRGPSLF